MKSNIFNKRGGIINFSIDKYFLKIILECYHFCPELPWTLTLPEVVALGFPAPFSYYSQSTINAPKGRGLGWAPRAEFPSLSLSLGPGLSLACAQAQQNPRS